MTKTVFSEAHEIQDMFCGTSSTICPFQDIQFLLYSGFSMDFNGQVKSERIFFLHNFINTSKNISQVFSDVKKKLHYNLVAIESLNF